jgi:hypothetical protein
MMRNWAIFLVAASLLGCSSSNNWSGTIAVWESSNRRHFSLIKVVDGAKVSKKRSKLFWMNSSSQVMVAYDRERSKLIMVGTGYKEISIPATVNGFRAIEGSVENLLVSVNLDSEDGELRQLGYDMQSGIFEVLPGQDIVRPISNTWRTRIVGAAPFGSVAGSHELSILRGGQWRKVYVTKSGERICSIASDKAYDQIQN